MYKYDKFPAKIYVDSFLKPDLFIYKNIFRDALFQINYAQCIMLNEQSIINDEEAKLIFENLYKIEYEFDFDSLEYDAKFEDLFFLVEKTLIEKIGVDIAGKLHTGRSRNDMEHTMFRIELRKKIISERPFSLLVISCSIREIISFNKEINFFLNSILNMVCSMSFRERPV